MPARGTIALARKAVRAENIGESGEKGTVMDWMRTGRRGDDDVRERVGVGNETGSIGG